MRIKILLCWLLFIYNKVKERNGETRLLDLLHDISCLLSIFFWQAVIYLTASTTPERRVISPCCPDIEITAYNVSKHWKECLCMLVGPSFRKLRSSGERGPSVCCRAMTVQSVHRHGLFLGFLSSILVSLSAAACYSSLWICCSIPASDVFLFFFSYNLI